MATVTRPLDSQQAEDAAETSRRVSDFLQRFADQVDTVVLSAEQSEGDECRLSLPRSALQLLREILEEMGRGNSVTIHPIHAELTTQEAADMLNVSRPFVVKLIREGRLPARHVGTHRRIRLEDVMGFKRREDAARRAALDELARDAMEPGLGYFE